MALLDHNPQDDDRQHPPGATASAGDPAVLRTQVAHKHLAKLEATGFVDWDREADATSDGPRSAELEPLVESLDAHRDELPEDWP